VTPVCTISMPSAAPTMPIFLFVPAGLGNLFVWMTDPGKGTPSSSCIKPYLNALGYAFRSHPSRGNSLQRSIRPLPSYIPIAGPLFGPLRFFVDI